MASTKHIDRETSSSVIFPLSESPNKHAPSPSPLRAPHLPFRRISLPTAPSLLYRVSVVSVSSFDSLPEGSDASPPPSARYNGKLGKGRPIPPESPRRRNRLRDTSTKPIDELQTSKRRKVVREFYDTEKAYVDGLDLVYSHFLTPIIASLDTPEPLLHRSALTSIFSNFIDIWNFHRSFLSSLTSLLSPPTGLPSTSSSLIPRFDRPIPPLSPLLLSHFPYLSLYNPFVTAFPSTTSAINDLVIPPTATRPNPLYDAKFAEFLATQEADPRCAKLKLRDWLLTIVQRCPRYLLLLKDLIGCTDKGDSEHSGLIAVHTLVSKITLSLNTSLHTHAQTLSLLALQRATPNLPLKLISPGRTLLKRGTLYQVERGSAPMQREFLLFSDCLMWLAPIEYHSWDWDWSWSGGSSSGISQNSAGTTVSTKTSSIDMMRTRSKSEAEISSLKDDNDDLGSVADSSPPKWDRRKSHYHAAAVPPPPPSMVKKRGLNDDRFVYKGRVELVDIEVVVGSALEDERRFEVLSPEGSFVVYAATEEERDDWTSEIRGAKTQLFDSLNVTNPNSTLTSSASTNHIRRSLQALPFPPSDDRLGTLRASCSNLDVSLSPNRKGRKKGKGKSGHSAERRRKVDHWVPAIWIPDGKTSSCMRCGRSFGWRRRRHHCRLCGRCVCASCSGRTFFISDSNAKQQDSSSSSSPSTTKPARACDACYDTVFPVIHPPTTTGEVATNNNNESHKSDTIPSLSHLPSWLSMPSLPVPLQPHALMAIDTTCSSRDIISFDDNNTMDDVGSETEERERIKGRIRIKSHQRERVRSYQQLLEDFQQQEEQSHAMRQSKASQSQMIMKGVGMDDDDDTFVNGEDDDDAKGVGVGGEEEQDHPFYTPTQSKLSSPVSSSRRKQRRRESTARRSKRFSLPAIGLQTTVVTARTSIESEEAVVVPVTTTGGSEEGVGVVVGGGGDTGLLKRYSLVLAWRNGHQVDGAGGMGQHEHGGQAKGLAAVRLSELLATKT